MPAALKVWKPGRENIHLVNPKSGLTTFLRHKPSGGAGGAKKQKNALD
jgi:hypothetical protein